MREDLLKHHVQIRESISNNLSTILSLIKQADSLRLEVEKIPETDIEQKVEIQNKISELNSSIESLIEQTRKLYESYYAMVDLLNKQS